MKLKFVVWTAWRGISFFQRLLHAKHQDTGIGMCRVPPIPGLPQNFYKLQFAASSRQGSIWRFPTTMIHSSPCCPPSAVKTSLHFFPKVTVQNQSWSFRKNTIPELFIHFDSTGTHWKHPRRGSSLSSHSINYYLLTSICLGAFRFFVWFNPYNRPVQMSLTPFSRWENLGSRAYLIQSGSLSHPQAESNLNPGILTLNPMFFVPHSSNQSSQLTAYSDTQAKSALHLRSSTQDLWPVELQWVKRGPMCSLIL